MKTLKHIGTVVVMLSLGLMAGCSDTVVIHDKTEQCVGIFNAGKPGYVYDIRVRNAIVGFVFSETLFVPAYVLLVDIKCPVRTMETK